MTITRGLAEIKLLDSRIKKQTSVEIPANYTGKICAHGFVIMVTGQGLEAVYNSDGTPAKCEI